MKITFWGVRGSIPCPGMDFVQYGGNTTFLTISDIEGWGENEYLTLDFGSGAKLFSESLADSAPARPPRILSLFSHVHWDHISGFPFFSPVYLKGTLIRMFSNNRMALQQSLAMQSNGINFPIEIENVAATLEYQQILHCQRIYAPAVERAAAGMHDSGETINMRQTGLIIDTLPLNHPQGCTGYRICELGTLRTFVYITDHESNRYMDHGLVEFISESDLVYIDGMYEGRSINRFKGYGHSSWEECAERFKRARDCKRMLIGHHDHTATDAHLRTIDAAIAERFPDGSVALGREGMVVDLS